MSQLSVLLAVYNSADHIGDLLDSLLWQSFGDFEILVRDDESTDESMEIVQRYAEADSRIRILPKGKNLGAAGNFFALLSACRCDYAMFSDADDLWLPDKIEKTFREMRRLEATSGRETPILVHTDLSVADAHLAVTAESFFEYEQISPARTELRQLLAQNNVTGCTAMVNRALMKLVPAMPKDAVMHDWWCALVASAFGRIGVVNEPLILYRQHGSNQVGAYAAASLSASAKRLADKERVARIYRAMFLQAKSFEEIYRDRLTPEQARICRRYGEMEQLGFFGRRIRLVSGGYWKNTFVRNLGQFIAL